MVLFIFYFGTAYRGVALFSSQDTRQVVTWGQGLGLPEEAVGRLVLGKISEPDDLVPLLHRSSQFALV